MKNFNTHFKGPRNMWKEAGNSVTLWSSGCEIFYSKKKLVCLIIHLWLFGFQVFEFALERKQVIR